MFLNGPTKNDYQTIMNSSKIQREEIKKQLGIAQISEVVRIINDNSGLERIEHQNRLWDEKLKKG